MKDPVRIPQELFARLMAAIENPDELTDEERTHVLEDADEFYPYEVELDDESTTPREVALREVEAGN